MIAILVPPSLAVTVCGVLVCCLCGFFAGLVPTLREASGPMKVALDLSYGRWALQCLAGEDFSHIPNALYADVGEQLIHLFAWPSRDELAASGSTACGKPLSVLFATGVVLRLLGCVALVTSHRDRQHKPPLFGSSGGGAPSAPSKKKPRAVLQASAGAPAAAGAPAGAPASAAIMV